MTSSRICAINLCERKSIAVCDCCEERVCIGHLREHAKLLNDQLAPLSTEINKLIHQFNNVSLPETYFLTELEMWSKNAHQKIERFCKEKKQEFVDFVRKDRIEIETKLNQLEDEIDQLIQEHNTTKIDIDSLNRYIRHFQQKINQGSYPQFTFSAFAINDESIHIQQRNISHLNLPKLTERYAQLGSSIAVHDQHILLQQGSNLLLLNVTQPIIKKCWDHGVIYDMFWSDVLDQFIILAEEGFYTVDEELMIIEQYPLRDRTDWYSGTCSKNVLFLACKAEGSSIYRYMLEPTIRLVEKFKSPVSCLKNEMIMDLSISNDALACVILNDHREVHLDLCSSRTLERHWSCYIGLVFGTNRIRCCFAFNNAWLVVEPNNSEILYISSDGKLIKEYDHHHKPRNAAVIGDHSHLVLTDNGLDFYQFE